MSIIKNELENGFHEMLTELKKPTWSDYVNSSGDIYKNVQDGNVMVESQADLASLSEYPPSTIAYTAGFTKMWQKAADGTWATIL